MECAHKGAMIVDDLERQIRKFVRRRDLHGIARVRLGRDDLVVLDELPIISTKSP
jgi:hypothetical protein